MVQLLILPELSNDENELVVIDEDSPAESLNHAHISHEREYPTGHINLYEKIDAMVMDGPFFSRLDFE